MWWLTCNDNTCTSGRCTSFKTPDDGRLRPKHVEWLCRNKACTVMHQVGVSFDLWDGSLRSHESSVCVGTALCTGWQLSGSSLNGESRTFVFGHHPGLLGDYIQCCGRLFSLDSRRFWHEGNRSHSLPRLRISGAVPPLMYMLLHRGNYASATTMTLSLYEETLCHSSLSKDACVSVSIRKYPYCQRVTFYLFVFWCRVTSCMSFRRYVCHRGTRAFHCDG